MALHHTMPRNSTLKLFEKRFENPVTIYWWHQITLVSVSVRIDLISPLIFLHQSKKKIIWKEIEIENGVGGVHGDNIEVCIN